MRGRYGDRLSRIRESALAPQLLAKKILFAETGVAFGGDGSGGIRRRGVVQVDLHLSEMMEPVVIFYGGAPGSMAAKEAAMQNRQQCWKHSP